MYYYISCIIVICIAMLITNVESTPSPELAKSIKYGCSAGGMITINATEFAANIKLRLMSSSPGGCQKPFLKNTTKTITISGCPAGQTVNVIKENIDSDLIYGGKNIGTFSLLCNDGVVTKTVTAHFTVNPTISVSEVQTLASPSVHLTINTCKSGSCSPATDAVVGEKLQLFASTSDQSHFVKFIDCSVDHSGDESVKLWSEKSCAVFKDLIETKPKVGPNTTSTTDTLDFYAFRYKKSNQITFSCNVRLCLKSSPKKSYCNMGCGGDNPTNARRKRSSASRNVRVSAVLNVRDLPYETSKGAAMPLNVAYLVTTMMAVFMVGAI